MSDQMTPQEFVAKIDWEGGVLDALIYGLKAKDLDDSDPEFKVEWFALEQAWAKFEPKLVGIEAMIARIGEDDD